MFYVLYISSDSTLGKIKSFLSKVLPGSELRSESDSELVICDDSFTLRVTTGGNNILFAREDYGCEFNYCLWFEIITDNTQWANKLIVITDKILSQLSNELVLESNGEKPFVYQDSSGVYVDSNLGGNESFPFNLISTDWEERELSRE
jgi:hypothetical protein